MPKAAIISHSRFVIAGVGMGTVFGVESSDRVYCVLPLYHSAGTSPIQPLHTDPPLFQLSIPMPPAPASPSDPPHHIYAACYIRFCVFDRLSYSCPAIHSRRHDWGRAHGHSGRHPSAAGKIQRPSLLARYRQTSVHCVSVHWRAVQVSMCVLQSTLPLPYTNVPFYPSPPCPPCPRPCSITSLLLEPL